MPTFKLYPLLCTLVAGGSGLEFLGYETDGSRSNLATPPLVSPSSIQCVTYFWASHSPFLFLDRSQELLVFYIRES